MQQIIIVGAGGHAAELRDYINDYNCVHENNLGLKVLGYLDDNKENYDHYAFEEPYLGYLQGHQIRKDIRYLMAIANLSYRSKIISEFEQMGATFTGFIHPTSRISPSAQIGQGVVISHSASVGPKVKIGNHTMINSRVTVGHDTEIGEFNFISPLCALSGNTQIGNGNMLGTNVITIPGIQVGDDNKIGAGVVLFFDVDSKQTIVGQKPRIL